MKLYLFDSIWFLGIINKKPVWDYIPIISASAHVEARGQYVGVCSFFPPLETQGAKSYHQIWQHLYTLSYHQLLKKFKLFEWNNVCDKICRHEIWFSFTWRQKSCELQLMALNTKTALPQSSNELHMTWFKVCLGISKTFSIKVHLRKYN